MEFSNSIVGASDELVREAIQSRGFVAGSTGWRIEANGNAEFNNVVIRGGLVVTTNAQSSNYVAGTTGWQIRSDGTAEFNGNVDLKSADVTGDLQSSNFVAATTGWRLRSDGTSEYNGSMQINNGTVFTGMSPNARAGLQVYTPSGESARPTLTLFDGTNADPGFVYGEDDGTQAAVFIGTGDYFGGGETGRRIGIDTTGFTITNETGTMFASFDMDFTQKTWPPTTGTGGNKWRITAPGGIYLLDQDTTYPYLVDGKIGTGVTTTNSASSTPVSIGAANLVNTPMQIDRCYWFLAQISVLSTVANDRVTFELWRGTVGTGANKRGASTNIKLTGGASQYQSYYVSFMWRESVSGVASNLNLSFFRLSGTGTCTAQVDSNYWAICMEMGYADRVGGL